MPAAAETWQQPIAAAGDAKAYRYLVLDNQLRVLLVSDPNTDRAGAALDVNVGNRSDPENWQGLAHLLEHMLFLGTDKFPEAGEYQSFITAHGGANNAYTSHTHTNYHFSIAPDYLRPALLRFSRFFIAPTLDATYVDRERKVVDSEYRTRLKDDKRRVFAAVKLALNPAHPISRFTVGTAHTLRDRESGAVRDKLQKFHDKYYSANLMSLAIIGNQSLDELEQWARELFSEVPNKNAARTEARQNYFAKLPLRVDVIPEQDQQSVSFRFPLPVTRGDYAAHSVGYIANFLGHEGEGSVLAVLKSRGWAQSLSAGFDYLDWAQSVFKVDIGLTAEGLQQIDAIGELLFAAIQQLQEDGVDAWRYAELQRLGLLDFEFADAQSPFEFTKSLAYRMQYYPPEDILRGPYLMREFKPARIKMLLSLLRADNVFVLVTAKRDDAADWQREKFYDVAYKIAPLAARTRAKWSAPARDAQLALPAPNPFIPERITPHAAPPAPSQQPERLETGDVTLAFHHFDPSFNAPKAAFYFNVKNPAANIDARASVMTEIYVRLLNEQLNKISYPARIAGLEYLLYRHLRGYSVRIDGYADKQNELLRVILRAIKASQFDADAFHIVKDQVARDLKNAAKRPPLSRSFQAISDLLLSPTSTAAEQLAALSEVTLADIQRHAVVLAAPEALAMLSHGDVTRADARQMVAEVRETFPRAKLRADIEPLRVRKLSAHKSYLRDVNAAHADTALVMYFQGGDGGDLERARMLLLAQLLEAEYYNDLRIARQAGYLVSLAPHAMLHAPGLVLAVQSSRYSPAEILQFNRMFLDNALQFDALQNADKFNEIKRGLVAQRRAKDKTLARRSNRWWNQMDRRQFDFGAKRRITSLVESRDLADIRRFFRRIIDAEPRLLLVQSTGEGGEGVSGMSAIDDIARFRERRRAFFPPRAPRKAL